jgi:hypothetical protein
MANGPPRKVLLHDLVAGVLSMAGTAVAERGKALAGAGGRHHHAAILSVARGAFDAHGEPMAASIGAGMHPAGRMSGPALPNNAGERVIAIINRVGELLSEHFRDDGPPPGNYERAIDANYKDLALVLTVQGARTVTIFSHEQGDPRTLIPLFAGHWHVQEGPPDITLWRNGPWEARFLTGDIMGTA